MNSTTKRRVEDGSCAQLHSHTRALTHTRIAYVQLINKRVFMQHAFIWRILYLDAPAFHVCYRYVSLHCNSIVGIQVSTNTHLLEETNALTRAYAWQCIACMVNVPSDSDTMSYHSAEGKQLFACMPSANTATRTRKFHIHQMTVETVITLFGIHSAYEPSIVR